MNQKMASKKNKNTKKSKNKSKNASNARRPASLPVVEEEQEEIITFGDKLLKAVAPYISTIAIALIAGFLGFAVIAFWMRSSSEKKAMEWRELNNATMIARLTNDNSAWKQVAEAYPNSKAGLWANQMAGDQQLRMGLEQLTYNRENGIGMIKKSKEYFQAVVDAPSSAKTPMLQQRSHFALAYAHESLGEFPESQALYEKLLTEAPDSAFAELAKRGAARSSNSDYGELFTKIENWEDEVVGEAPGAKLPERPNLDFNMPDLPSGDKPPAESPTVSGGGDFKAPEVTDPGTTTPETTTPVAPETTPSEGVVEPSLEPAKTDGTTEVETSGAAETSETPALEEKEQSDK